MPLDIDAARAVVAALDLGETTVSPLGQGFASEAWLVRTGDAAYVLRVERPDAGYPSTYRAEHGVMTALGRAGRRGPAAGRRQLDGPGLGRPGLLAHDPGGRRRRRRTTVLAGIDRPGRRLHPRPPVDPGDRVRAARCDAMPSRLPSSRTSRPGCSPGSRTACGRSARGRCGAHPALAGHPGLAARIDRHARRRPGRDGRGPVRPRPLGPARGEHPVRRRPAGLHRLRRDVRRDGGLGGRDVRLLHVLGAGRRADRRARRRWPGRGAASGVVGVAPGPVRGA